MKTYRVQVFRSDRWWAIEAPEVKGAHSQARHLREVESMARDVIALMEEIDPDSFDLDVDYQMPNSVRQHLTEAQRLRHESDEAKSAAAAESRAAVRELVESGLPLRDVGVLLGMSYQRVHQLAA